MAIIILFPFLHKFLYTIYYRVEESNMMSIEPNTSLYEDSSHQIEPTKKSTSLNNSLVGAPKNKKSKRGEHSNGFAFASEKELVNLYFICKLK